MVQIWFRFSVFEKSGTDEGGFVPLQPWKQNRHDFIETLNFFFTFTLVVQQYIQNIGFFTDARFFGGFLIWEFGRIYRTSIVVIVVTPVFTFVTRSVGAMKILYLVENGIDSQQVGILHAILFYRSNWCFNHLLHQLFDMFFRRNVFRVDQINVIKMVEPECRKNQFLYQHGCAPRIDGLILSLFIKHVDDIHSETFIGFLGQGKITVTAAGLNIKTTYFVRNSRFLLTYRFELICHTQIFVFTCRGFDGRCEHFIDRNVYPSRRTDVVNMKITEHRGDIAFV